jgi:xylulokinase
MKRLEHDAEAPFGDAFLAGLGVGVFSDPSEIKSWLAFRAPTIPDEKNHEIYSRRFPLYKKAYVQSREIMSELADIQANGM